jgi:hypothetical protein
MKGFVIIGTFKKELTTSSSFRFSLPVLHTLFHYFNAGLVPEHIHWLRKPALNKSNNQLFLVLRPWWTRMKSALDDLTGMRPTQASNPDTVY